MLPSIFLEKKEIGYNFLHLEYSNIYGTVGKKNFSNSAVICIGLEILLLKSSASKSPNILNKS